jgi:hypothetical protein
MGYLRGFGVSFDPARVFQVGFQIASFLLDGISGFILRT